MGMGRSAAAVWWAAGEEGSGARSMNPRFQPKLSRKDDSQQDCNHVLPTDLQVVWSRMARSTK
eukprot:scaffold4235_cov32-Tisochrysis_lutea.AAC.1